MNTNAEGAVMLNETEKETVLQGLRLMSVYCETRLGCAGCPFYLGYEIQKDGGTACELKNYLPCGWTLPDKWTKEGDK